MPICFWSHTRLWGTKPKSYPVSGLQSSILRCYLTPQADPRLGLCFWEYIFPLKKAASRKAPLCSGVAAYCNTLIWQRRLQRPCSCPGLQPGALAEGASSHVQVFYESQTCTRRLMPSSVCSWFYQLPFKIKLFQFIMG